jgi:hypothetical protein
VLSSSKIALSENKPRPRLMHIELDRVLASFDCCIVVACERVDKRERNKRRLRSRIEPHRLLG